MFLKCSYFWNWFSSTFSDQKHFFRTDAEGTKKYKLIFKSYYKTDFNWVKKRYGKDILPLEKTSSLSAWTNMEFLDKDLSFGIIWILPLCTDAS